MWPTSLVMIYVNIALNRHIIDYILIFIDIKYRAFKFQTILLLWVMTPDPNL